jgi:MFS family permease
MNLPVGQDLPRVPRAPGPTWAPLYHRFFAALWLATLISNIGSWAQDLASSWLMLNLVPGNASAVGLLQAASALPTFLLVLPAGALADIVDRRFLLVLAQIAMIGAAGLLAVSTAVGVISANILLVFALAVSAGAALGAPASQAWISELVPQAEVPAAAALSSLAANVARALGPLVGGVAVALAGPAAAFGFNAISTVGVLLVLVLGRDAAPRPEAARLPPEHFFPALRAGVRYAWHGVLLRRVLARGLLFFVPASALWALLPVLARGPLRLDAAAYGALLATMGAGIVAGALALPAIRHRVTVDLATATASILLSVAMSGLATAAAVGSVALACAMLPMAGVAWIVMLAHFSVAAQGSVAGWVKARALALYLVTSAGATALGSPLWGILAQSTGLATALCVAAGSLVAGLVAVRRIPLGGVGTYDLRSASHHAADAVEIIADDRLVMIEITYDVAPENEAAFATAIRALRRTRLRTGAYGWVHLRDRDNPELHREQFWLASWLEHLRQRRVRETVFDAELQRRVRGLVRPGTEPVVQHLLHERSATRS